MVSVTIKNLTKTYGNTIAIENLNFQLKDGEFFTLLGPSGCGKTTTLYSVAGLLEPDEGEIKLGNKIATSTKEHIHAPPQNREISMVFQDYALYPHMTVSKILAFPLENKGINKKEIEKRVKKTAELLDIGNLLNRKPSQLSGGQKQRVALGRAIIRNPKVFLFDEPLSNLDAKLRIRMRAELKKLQKKLGVTTIYVTHDQIEAMTMSDRIMLLKDGKSVQVGTPDDLFSRPKNLFVAGFIGAPPMNFIDCTIRKNRKLWFDAREFKIPVLSKIMPKLEEYIDKEVVIGIRPQNLSEKKSSKEEQSEYSIRGNVDVIEPMGTNFLLHVSSGDHSLIIETRETESSLGEETIIEMDPEKMHVFDKETKKAIINAIASQKK
jgi:multiple sugar transport system ATP-binding protein